MTGTPRTRRESRFPVLFSTCALLAAAVGPAGAQTCTGALPTPGAAVAAGGDKFQLIVQQCQPLSAPVNVRRSAQLDLYDHGSVTIPMSEPVEERPAPALSSPNSLFAAPAQPVPSATPPERDVARVVALAPSITAAAQAYGVDPLLLHAIAHVESRHSPRAVSPAGARGVMQVMPATARRFGVADERALFDADTNLRASAAYLRNLLRRYGNDLRLVLAAYNAGEGAVDKAGGDVPPYAETQAYVRDVLAIYRRLAATFAVSPTGALVARAETRGAQ